MINEYLNVLEPESGIIEGGASSFDDVPRRPIEAGRNGAEYIRLDDILDDLIASRFLAAVDAVDSSVGLINILHADVVIVVIEGFFAADVENSRYFLAADARRRRLLGVGIDKVATCWEIARLSVQIGVQTHRLRRLTFISI